MIVVKHLIYGGTEKYTLNLANTLAEKGISVILVTSGGPLTNHLSSKIKVFITPISRKPRIKQITERKIYEIAKKYKPQIIHTQCRTSMICSQMARTYLKIPLLTHEHHMYDQSDYPFIVGELEEGSDKIITIGPYTTKELVKHGIKKDKIATVLNGVMVKNLGPISKLERKEARVLFNLKNSDKVVVCLSRVEKGKGIDKLIRGFIKVIKQISNAKLVIAGDDQLNPAKSDLNLLIKNNNLQKSIFLFPGEYNIRKYHAIADVFCYPALCKGMAVMEAMAAGLPIVGKRTTRRPLVVEHNISGLMTESTAQYKIDPSQISEKLIFLLKRPELVVKMGIQARKRIEQKFPFSKSYAKTQKVYNDVIKAGYLSSRKELFEYLYT